MELKRCGFSRRSASSISLTKLNANDLSLDASETCPLIPTNVTGNVKLIFTSSNMGARRIADLGIVVVLSVLICDLQEGYIAQQVDVSELVEPKAHIAALWHCYQVDSSFHDIEERVVIV